MQSICLTTQRLCCLHIVKFTSMKIMLFCVFNLSLQTEAFILCCSIARVLSNFTPSFKFILRIWILFTFTYSLVQAYRSFRQRTTNASFICILGEVPSFEIPLKICEIFFECVFPMFKRLGLFNLCYHTLVICVNDIFVNSFCVIPVVYT